MRTLGAQGWWIGLGIGSCVLFVATVIAVPRLVGELPPDYFVARRGPGPSPARRSLGRLVRFALRNTAGAVLVAFGIAMLFLPGQGLLTLLVGLALMDFPGKRGLEVRLAGQRHVRRSLQWMRARAGQPPLRFDPRDDSPDHGIAPPEPTSPEARKRPPSSPPTG